MPEKESLFINFESRGDERGILIPFEAQKTVPFDIKRVFLLTKTKVDIKRGCHAHKHLNQIAVAVKGSCKFILDTGHNREIVILDRPDKGLILKPMVWHEMYDFSEDCVLMVLADNYYDESSYIRNYDDFLSVAKLNKR